MERHHGRFIWDLERESSNIEKHGVDFTAALKVFLDPRRKIFTDSQHSNDEQRYFCIGKVGDRIMTVRFTYRDEIIRIFGAGYWRKGRRYYEKE